MSTRTRAVMRAAPTGGRNMAIAVGLGVLFGQLGYLYTRQPKRFMLSTLMCLLGLGLLCAAILHQFPDIFDMQALLDNPTVWLDHCEKATFWPSILFTVLNNGGCAVDLYFQTRR